MGLNTVNMELNIVNMELNTVNMELNSVNMELNIVNTELTGSILRARSIVALGICNSFPFVNKVFSS